MLRYKGITHTGLEEQVKINAQDISELQEVVGSIEKAGTIEVAGTSGTLTANQLATLLNNSDYTITNSGSIFRQTENQEADGYLIYSSINQAGMTEILSITLSVGSWVVTTVDTATTMYAHNLFTQVDDYVFRFSVLSSSPASLVGKTVKEVYLAHGQVLIGYFWPTSSTRSYGVMYDASGRIYYGTLVNEYVVLGDRLKVVVDNVTEI